MNTYTSAANTPVLVVDDFATMRRVAIAVLKELGFKTFYEAENGQSALSILESKPVGLVVSDWNMPVMDGLTLLKNVRANEKTRHVPMLMLTAEGQRDNVIEAVKAGASGYVVKPFSPASLQEKVRSLFLKKAA